MTILVSSQNIRKAHGARVLFKNLSFGIFERDRIGLIGPNGAGKSSLLKILASIESADSGFVTKKKETVIAYVPQESLFPKESSVEEIIFNSLPNRSSEYEIFAKICLGKVGLKNFSLQSHLLSGGEKKRLEIAIALAKKPDLLLLDEPTNHLDMEGIIWLENFLNRENLTFVVISHDRYFLENVTNKIAEINPTYPEGIFISEGNYSSFLQKREDFFLAEQSKQQSLSSKVRREIEWLKQNPKARTTKAQSRIQEAGQLIDQLSELKTRNRTQEIQSVKFSQTEKQTKQLLVAKNLSKKYQDKTLFVHQSITIVAGSRIGIVGRNGSGKTTFLKIIAGQIAPDQGHIKYAEDLKIVYFDQHRENLGKNVTLKEALAEGKETVNYRGQNIHVSSYAKRFLFDSDILQMPISELSGGERARVLIAKLMLKPADLLILDEPTNDLDIQTLEILEESLNDFAGGIVFVTHDRALLDRLSTQILAIDIPSKEGMDENLFVDFRKWQEKIALKEEKVSSLKESTERKEVKKALPSSSEKKLSFKEKQELAEIEEKISKLEEEIELLNVKINESLPSEIENLCKELSFLQDNLDKHYQRWQELENKKSI